MKRKFGLFIGILAMSSTLLACEDTDITVNDGEVITTSIVEDFNIDDVVVDISNETFVTEAEFESYMHRMTHQKVSAEVKWGEFEASPKNVKFLIEILERDGSEYEHADFYREVLDDWKEGDFSNAVEVHNQIWHRREGSVGKAYRLLTPEEEQEFVERNFK